MPTSPKKARRKRSIKKQDKKKGEKPIGEAFPNITSATLEQLQNFYKMGLSSRLTSTQPGMPGRETTRKVFLYLDEELLKDYDMDANNRQKLAKQKLKESCERVLLKLEIQLSKVEKALASKYDKWLKEATELSKKTPPELPKPFEIDIKTERLRLQVIKTIGEVRDNIAKADFTLTIHEQDEKAILDHLEMKASVLSEKIEEASQ
jgi:hypothetical protein